MIRFRVRSAGRLCARFALIGMAIAVVGVLAGCGSNTASPATSSATTSGTASSAGSASAEAKVVPVVLHLATGSYAVSTPGTTISGTASKGASVAVNGRDVTVRSGHWRDQVHLHIGNNPIEVEATMSGRAPATTVIHVVRRHSAAEREALARVRALGAEAKRRHETEVHERKEREAVQKRETEQHQQQAECPNGTYENSAGNIVCKPYESPTQPAGATARCEDGTYSFSESRSGTCSHHGGVAVWLNE
jgi:hypothetical protein